MALQNTDPRCYLIRVKRVLTLFMMATMMLVSGTSLAAAMCVHEDAAGHAQALQADDAGDAAVAHLEDSAGAAAAKRGTVDAGSFMLPAFVLPASEALFAAPARTIVPPVGMADAAPGSRSIPPLLEPPAA